MPGSIFIADIEARSEGAWAGLARAGLASSGSVLPSMVRSSLAGEEDGSRVMA